jgi:CheY-like chemotaxis protein
MIQPSSNIRALLVDDDPDQLELIDMAIGNMDKSLIVESVSSSEKALELIHSQPFDCIISDYIMPVMNGLELCEKLRAEGCNTPFILFTCQDDEKVVDRAYKVGVDYLQKEPSLTTYNILSQLVRNLVLKGRAEEGSHQLD